MKIDVIHNGEKLASVKIRKDVIKDLTKEEIRHLLQAALWDEWIHPFTIGDICANPWLGKNEKIDKILKKNSIKIIDKLQKDENEKEDDSDTLVYQV